VWKAIILRMSAYEGRLIDRYRHNYCHRHCEGTVQKLIWITRDGLQFSLTTTLRCAGSCFRLTVRPTKYPRAKIWPADTAVKERSTELRRTPSPQPHASQPAERKRRRKIFPLPTHPDRQAIIKAKCVGQC